MSEQSEQGSCAALAVAGCLVKVSASGLEGGERGKQAVGVVVHRLSNISSTEGCRDPWSFALMIVSSSGAQQLGVNVLGAVMVTQWGSVRVRAKESSGSS